MTCMMNTPWRKKYIWVEEGRNLDQRSSSTSVFFLGCQQGSKRHQIGNLKLRTCLLSSTIKRRLKLLGFFKQQQYSHS